VTYICFRQSKKKFEWIQVADEDQFFEWLQGLLRGIDQQELDSIFQAWLPHIRNYLLMSRVGGVALPYLAKYLSFIIFTIQFLGRCSSLCPVAFFLSLCQIAFLLSDSFVFVFNFSIFQICFSFLLIFICMAFCFSSLSVFSVVLVSTCPCRHPRLRNKITEISNV
jgi:hypothetical protein